MVSNLYDWKMTLEPCLIRSIYNSQVSKGIRSTRIIIIETDSVIFYHMIFVFIF